MEAIATQASGPTSKAFTKLENDIVSAATKAGVFDKQLAASKNTYAALNTAADGYKKTLKELSRVENATQTSSGQYRGAGGRFLATDDVKKYESALRGLNAVEAERVRLLTAGNKAEAARPAMRPTYPIGHPLANVSTVSAASPAAKIDTSASDAAVARTISNTQKLKTAFMETSNSTRYLMYDVSNSLAIGAVAAVAFGAAGLAAAVKWESSFAAVRRTVGGTEAEMDHLYGTLKKMSMELPVSFSELSEIASLGGQLGINAQGISQFTETVAKLTATTSLSATAAGTALGRFKSFFATVQGGNQDFAVTEDTFTNLASSILKVGVNSVATETGIVNVATQISSMGSYAGLTADQVVGLAGALSSVGVPPELSRGVITRLFTTMGEAVATGGEELGEFGRISGMSSESFKASWGSESFGDTVLSFMRGLKDEGDQAVFTLHNLGITSVRDVPVLMRLAGAADEAGRAGGLLKQTMEDSRSGWEDNTELALQYSIIAETTAARLTVLGQSFEALFATIGNAGNGPLKFFVNMMIDIVTGLTAMAETDAGQVVAGIGIAVSLLTGALFLLVSGLARATAMAIGFKQAMLEASISAGVAAGATKAFNIALITTGVGAVIVLIGSLAAAFAAAGLGAASATGAIKDTAGLYAAMKKDTDLGTKSFGTFSGRVMDAGRNVTVTGEKAKRLSSILYGTKDAGEAAGDGMKAGARDARQASIEFGQAATDFVKSQLAMDTQFQEVAGDTGFVAYWDAIGASTDEAIKASAKNGREGVEEYFRGLEAEFLARSNDFKMFEGSLVSKDGKTELGGVDAVQGGGGFHGAATEINKYINAVGGVKEAALRAAAEQRVLNGEVESYSDANDLASMSVDDLVAANEKVVTSMAGGIAKFSDMGGLISTTQDKLKAAAEASAEAYRTSMEGTDAELDKSKDSWDDYYDGVSFSLEQYLTNFQAAANEQKAFTDGLSSLSARGLSQDIIAELAELGPQAKPLVQALVDGTDVQLKQFEELWGKTGTNAATKYAANLVAADIILKNAGAVLGETATLAMLAEVNEGRLPFVDILRKYGLDASGNKIPIHANTGPAVDTTNGYVRWVASLRAQLQVDARVGIVNKGQLESYLNSMNMSLAGKDRVNAGQFYTGGYTGAGGKYDVAGAVHRGEFVFDAASTKNIGIGNLYAQMRAARGATPAPKPGGFAGGGFAGGNGFSTLDANALQAILALANRPIYLYASDRVIAESASRGAQEQTLIGSS